LVRSATTFFAVFRFTFLTNATSRVARRRR
jgi:hypothetical protein